MSFFANKSTNRSSDRAPQRGAKRTNRRTAARRLLLESLDVRQLLAFDVLGTYPTGANPVEVEMALIDGDSRLDMVVLNATGASIDVRLGNGDGTFGSAITSPAGLSPHSLAVGDFNSDSFTDVATLDSNGVNLLAGNGDGTFDAPQSIALPTTTAPGDPTQADLTQFPRSIAAGDLNADGEIDLVVGTDTYFTQKVPSYYPGYYYYYNAYDGHVNVLMGNGTGEGTSLNPAQTHHIGADRIPYTVAAGDVTGDDKPDVIAATYYGLSVLSGDGLGGLGAPQHSGAGYPLPSISLGDLDGDSNVDTILSSGSGLIVQKGDGAGNFTTLPSLSTGSPVNSAVLGDVNGDQILDIVVAGSTGSYSYESGYTHSNTVAVLLSGGDGNFALPLTSSLGGGAGYGWLPDVVVTELTGDSQVDLVALDYYTGEAIVAANDGVWLPPASIVISDVTVTEGTGSSVSAEFTVTLLGDHGDVSVVFETGSNDATPGSDYTTTSGTLNFIASESSKKFSVTVLGDSTDEYNQQFYVLLSGASGALITDPTGFGTIVDNDDAPTISIGDAIGNEGQKNNTTLSFIISLSAASEKLITVNFTTANGTATLADSDYFLRSGTAYFYAGDLQETVTVTVRADKKKETDETFFVNLSGASNATIADGEGLGTIRNDDKGNGNPHNRAIAAAFADDTATKKKK